MIRLFILIIFLLSFFSISSQEKTNKGKAGPSGFFKKIKDSMSIGVKSFNFDVKEYKSFNNHGDTIILDTSLTIQKYYKFNYRKKDNLELLKFNNVGQVYNRLTFSNKNDIFTTFGYNANNTILLNSNDIMFYDVAYPITELFFKSVFSQGQLTDAFFTSNINKKTNFSLGFRALRSLGKYQNNLSGSKHFRFGFSYSGKALETKLFFLSQKLEKHENGGLTLKSLQDFISKNLEFKERAKLDVNFENAKNNFNSRYFFLNNKLFFNKVPKNNFYLTHEIDYQTSNNIFSQQSASILYGNLSSGSTIINDHFKFRTLKNTISFNSSNKFLDYLSLGYVNYNYNFFDEETSSSLLSKNTSSFTSKMEKEFSIVKLILNLNQKISGDRLGSKYNLKLISNRLEKINFGIILQFSKAHPGIMYDLYKSDYNEINFDKENKLNEVKFLEINLEAEKFGKVNLNISEIYNHFYITTDNNLENYMTPILNQFAENIGYLKIKYENQFNFGIFSIDNALIYQNLDQTKQIINLPKFIVRSSIFLSEKIFNNAMDIQTGFSLKVFSKFFADEYNPAISSFNIQNDIKIGGYPIVDFFFNAKIRQTRIFLIAEHFNSSFDSNNFFSSPRVPYRDRNIRFGFNWNLFN